MRQKLVDFFNLVFGFRKLLAWLGIFIVGIIFRLHGEIDGAQFVDLLKGTFLGFVAANGFEHVMSTVKTVYNSKNKPADLEEVTTTATEEVK